MKVLSLNLPNKEQITRRYMCSYVAPDSLMPPLELISCAAIAREWHGAEVKLIDAIAEKKNLQQTLDAIHEFKPDVIISITGFECFEDDVNLMREIKAGYGKANIVYFGHYATYFPEETLRFAHADYVILGEPEHIFDRLLKALSGRADLSSIDGIAYKKGLEIVVQGAAERIRNPNELPVPAYDLLPGGERYYEPLIPKPYGMIQTIRGCPYACTYCVKSYGTKVSQLSTERILHEMKAWKQLFGVKAIRFIDDTFTINRNRVIELSKAIIAENLKIKWVCLSRTDNLDREMLQWMKKSGCIRIYFGMESGSQRMLDLYKKNVDEREALDALRICREVGIETAAFFMGGHSGETEQDFLQTIRFARESKLNYVSYNPLTLYPGTPLYDQMKDQVEFSIYPYKNIWKNREVYSTFEKRKDRFYKSFYFRFSFLIENIPVFFRNFKEAISLGTGLIRYLVWDKQFVISGLKGSKDK